MKFDDETSAGSVERLEIPGRERIKAGFKAGGVFWIIAPFCLPLPLLHFILVPLFLVLGTVKAWSHWTSPRILQHGKTSCPKCQNKIEIENIPDQWPLKIHCSNCGHLIRLYEKSSAK